MPVREDILSRAERVLGRVTDKGANGDLIVSEGTSLTLKARDGDLEAHEVSSRHVYGVRVIKDDRTGIAYSEASDGEALCSMVDQALHNAAFARTDPDERIPDHSETLATEDAVLFPPDDTTLQVKVATALDIERKLSARKMVKSVPHNGVHDRAQEQHVFSTAGLCASSRSRSCSAWSYALAEDGDRNIVAGIHRSVRQFNELDIDAIVDETHARCLSLLEGEAVPSRRYDVLFDTECQNSLFRTFSMMFSAKAAKDGVNPMREKVGEMVADPALSICDAPRRTEGLRYALFDDEGTPTATTPPHRRRAPRHPGSQQRNRGTFRARAHRTRRSLPAFAAQCRNPPARSRSRPGVRSGTHQRRVCRDRRSFRPALRRQPRVRRLQPRGGGLPVPRRRAPARRAQHHGRLQFLRTAEANCRRRRRAALECESHIAHGAHPVFGRRHIRIGPRLRVIDAVGSRIETGETCATIAAGPRS